MRPPVYLILDYNCCETQTPKDAVCFLRRGGGLESKFPNGHEIAALDRDTTQGVANGFAGLIADLPPGPVPDIAWAMSNDIYEYTLLPVMEIIQAVADINQRHPDQTIHVITPRHRGTPWPLLGFRTLESTRGSANLLSAFAARLLPKIFPDIQISFVHTRPDLHFFDPVRRGYLWAINVVFHINVIVKLLLYGRGTIKAASLQTIDKIVMVRAAHHARFAAQMLSKPKADTAVLVFPQFSDLSIRSFRRLVDHDLAGVARIGIPWAVLLRGLAWAWVQKRRLKHSPTHPGTLEVAGQKIDFDLIQVLQDIRHISVIFSYQYCLAEMISRCQAQKLISFEIKGRVAGLESRAVRDANANANDGCRYVNIQTVLLPSKPLPVFPFGDQFFTDSQTTQAAIHTIGSHKLGRVMFAGSPYKVVADMHRPTRFEKISFFTQPDETYITGEILRVLGQWARQNDSMVSIRLHPRDTGKAYADLLQQYPQHLHLEQTLPLSQIIAQSDVGITRTSSVAKDILAAGIPLIVCPWSEINKSFTADFILDLPKTPYKSVSAQDLQDILNTPAAVIGAAQHLRHSFWRGYTTADLLQAVFE